MILCGIKSLTIIDDAVCVRSDLGGQFLVSDASVAAQRTRAEASIDALRELANGRVTVELLRSAVSNDDVARYQALVVADCRSLSTLLELNDACRAANATFVVADAFGALGVVFCDVGERHVVLDVAGERAPEYAVASISASKPCRVVVQDSVLLQFDASTYPTLVADRVRFVDVRGATALNSLPPQRVVVTGPFSFELPDVDSSEFGALHEAFSGTVLHMPAPHTVTHVSLADALESSSSSSSATLSPTDVAHCALYSTILESTSSTNASNSSRLTSLADTIVAKLKQDYDTVNWRE